MRHLIAIALLVTVARVEAASPPVQLVLRDGMVWLVARDAPISQIFEEWARVGQTRVVNAEQLTGRLSVDLNGMPEGEALDILLRAVGGFVAKQRGVADVAPDTARSQFAEIVIVAGRGQTPRVAAAAAAAPAPPAFQQPPSSGVTVAPGVQRLIGADGQPVPDDQEGAPVAAVGAVPRPPAPSMPPGFATPPQARPAAPAPAPQTGPAGSPVPGMVVPAPTNTPAVRRPSGL